jgi:hypothetical protein
MNIGAVSLALSSLVGGTPPRTAQNSQSGKPAGSFAPLDFKQVGASQNNATASASTQSAIGKRLGALVDIKV